MTSESQASLSDFYKDVIRHGENFVSVAAKVQPKKVPIFGKRLLVQGKVAINEMWQDLVGRMNGGEMPKLADLEIFWMLKWTLAINEAKMLDDFVQKAVQSRRSQIELAALGDKPAEGDGDEVQIIGNIFNNLDEASAASSSSKAAFGAVPQFDLTPRFSKLGQRWQIF